MVTRIRKSWFTLARHEDPPTDPPTDPPGATPPADPPADPAPTDDLGDAGKRALDAERKARREAEARAKTNEDAAARLKELEDAQKSEQERLQEAKDTAERERDDARVEIARLRVMTDLKLDADLEQFLTARDENGLREQAATLKAKFDAAGPRVPEPDPGQGAGKTPPGEVDMREASPEDVKRELRKLGARSYG